MRRLLKFLHTMGAAGVIGAMATLVVLASVAPPPSQLPAYAAVRGAMGTIATWMFLPSLAFALIAGLLSMGDEPRLPQRRLGVAEAASPAS